MENPIAREPWRLPRKERKERNAAKKAGEAKELPDGGSFSFWQSRSRVVQSRSLAAKGHNERGGRRGAAKEFELESAKGPGPSAAAGGDSIEFGADSALISRAFSAPSRIAA